MNSNDEMFYLALFTLLILGFTIIGLIKIIAAGIKLPKESLKLEITKPNNCENEIKSEADVSLTILLSKIEEFHAQDAELAKENRFENLYYVLIGLVVATLSLAFAFYSVNQYPAAIFILIIAIIFFILCFPVHNKVKHPLLLREIFTREHGGKNR